MLLCYVEAACQTVGRAEAQRELVYCTTTLPVPVLLSKPKMENSGIRKKVGMNGRG